ncbi:MAG: peptidoglycan glycosyltransferase [Clostridium sp.]|jgi:stage V sporulation protein D (sporulation-specific penicillin-binding protein)|nr:peptidoglycan glycosyltransferase [Clostridium sp.]
MFSNNNKIFHRKKILIVFFLCTGALLFLFGRLVYLMVWRADHYSRLADQLHERERSIKAQRGRILDSNGTVLADNKTVCTISVIHNQIEDPGQVVEMLCRELGLTEEYVKTRVEKYTSLERIKSNVDKATGDRIREYDLAGVKVDEDYKRYYPFGELASKVMGFTGGDNQGIIGLEVIYEKYLQGQPGNILTITDAKGLEIEAAGERRQEPTAGNDLHISLDMNIQAYATQLAKQAMATKQADGVSILVMNPQNGEIMAMVDLPEFDLNAPYELPEGTPQGLTAKEEQNILNAVWRNGCINDTYEPGSTFKIITAAAGLESGSVSVSNTFHCPGYIVVDDRRIRCAKVTGHGTQDFVHATMNSCNPAFVTIGLNIGVDTFFDYFQKFGLLKKTGVDLPGEAGTIMHKPENMGNVELATVSFGQSFQITPIQLLATAASILNGGNRVTPHFGVRVTGPDGATVEELDYPVTERILSEETSQTLRGILELVVAEGTGKNGKVEGFHIGGKTATSQTLPRQNGVYIASFLGFAPAQDPQVIALAIVHNPKGVYYGGQIAAPVIRQLYENILPYLGIQKEETQPSAAALGKPAG